MPDVFNRYLADMVLDQIRKHPEQWDQESWWSMKPECGTAFCFAGWIAHLDGYRPVIDNFHSSDTEEQIAWEVSEYGRAEGSQMVDDLGDKVRVEAYAISQLFPGAYREKVWDDAELLFDSRNTFRVLVSIVDHLDWKYNGNEE